MSGISIKQLAHACILTPDLDATERFYRKVLGMAVTFNFTHDGEKVGLYLSAGGRTFVEVFENLLSRYAAGNAIDHLCFEVDDLDAAIAHIGRHGGSITEKSLGPDDTWQAWTTDPNGVRIELFEYTKKSAQFVGGDRVMKR